MENFDWVPVSYWPDAYTRTMMTEDPSSPLFQEMLSYALRAELDAPDRLIASADISAVLTETIVSIEQLADRLQVPPIYVYACARGWHRVGLRGLALIAEALDEPLATFFLHADGRARMDVRRYNSYRLVAPHVTIMGGGLDE